MRSHFLRLAFAGTLAFFGGCASETTPASVGSPIVEAKSDDHLSPSPQEPADSENWAAVTDNVVNSILDIQEIANARLAPHIVLNGVVNHTGFAIDRQFFLSRLRVMLNVKAMNHARFVDAPMLAALTAERAKARSSGTQAGSGADYFLVAQLDGPTTSATGEHVLCSFHLTDARSGVLVWQDSYEITREGLDPSAFW